MKTIWEHLRDLRRVFIVPAIIFAIVFLVSFQFSGMIIQSLINFFGLSGSVVTLTPIESIETKLRVSLILSIVLVVPIFLYSVYRFTKELITVKYQRKIKWYISLAFLLGAIGATFGLMIFSKFVLNFLFGGNIAEPMWSILGVINFALLITLIMVITMQIIIILPLLSKLGIDVKQLKKYRGVTFVTILILSAIITPPDVVSQILITIPTYGSWELGLLFS